MPFPARPRYKPGLAIAFPTGRRLILGPESLDRVRSALSGNQRGRVALSRANPHA